MGLTIFRKFDNSNIVLKCHKTTTISVIAMKLEQMPEYENYVNINFVWLRSQLIGYLFIEIR